MAAETAKQFDALEAQAQVLMSVFAKAGHDAVAPAIIQPADVFLDCIGETLRARTYVFTDPDGAELCLRPDLTVPTCRLHIARYADAATPARYCYNGPAFRFQPQGADAVHPREFRQCGIERFGDAARDVAEAETMALVVRALETAGLKTWRIRTGDLGLFRAVLDALGVPERWLKRLSDAFWRPDLFRAELKRLASDPASIAARLPAELRDALDPHKPNDAEAVVAAYLDARGIEMIGRRTIGEMTAHLLDMAADAKAAPIDAATATLIERYAAVSETARTAGETIARLLAGTRGGVGAALDAYDRRLVLLANAGIDLDRVAFSAEFGRNLEYYTGLVFEVLAPGLDDASPVAGGGRYDRLMRAAGANADVPAVGAAIHTERLLHVVHGGGA
ncbi:MAG: ATP phosphoribosyltransferase regulatory subunit [Hyphomicrobium sp.]